MVLASLGRPDRKGHRKCLSAVFCDVTSISHTSMLFVCCRHACLLRFTTLRLRHVYCKYVDYVLKSNVFLLCTHISLVAHVNVLQVFYWRPICWHRRWASLLNCREIRWWKTGLDNQITVHSGRCCCGPCAPMARPMFLQRLAATW